MHKHCVGCIVSIITSFHSLKIYLGMFCLDRDPFVKNEMGGTCSTYGGEKKYLQGFGGET